ncbi:MAG TPA: RluA family pseudouridine synthase [Polyangiaceae bacterium]|nr:RluA family pseudouridine synthase [Polyangiaceae bacterium]
MARYVLAGGHERERVDKALARLCAPTSRATIQRWISEGRVRVLGNVCRPRDMVGPGTVIDVEPGPEPTSQAEPDAGVSFDVVHEDAHLIVVAKPAGVVVHPARGHRRGTLVSGLIARPGFTVAPADERDPEGKLRPGIVHRIDKDTSGLLVVAKDAATREGLKRQLAEHSVARIYHALTVGVPRSERIETLYGRHPRSRLRFTSRLEQGKRAVTNVRVLETFDRGAAAWVECRLETGRTHQIRVHLSERSGTPLIADALYGAQPSHPRVRALAAQLGRHALHARTLGFVHPITGERMSFDSELPDDMRAALAALRAELDAPPMRR